MTGRYAIWFARGLDARRRSVEFPTATNFKDCPTRKGAFQDGFNWGGILLNQAKDPPEDDFLDEVVARHFEKARQLTGGQ
jgi:hypothetical protein